MKTSTAGLGHAEKMNPYFLSCLYKKAYNKPIITDTINFMSRGFQIDFSGLYIARTEDKNFK